MTFNDLWSDKFRQNHDFIYWYSYHNQDIG